ncbi:DMT family transporter [Acuticoccus sp. MNP-M23]|uniref:DMT family transporter n=1 Tax=Acuticoccus sp. MNP-M23 TaxID=3072793 RepID=UPI00281547B8|nr:DMT family transporter [Acuticoccus sp. MNP-M23]WMS42580.1 DMT family transporter [Acuticoccus sp. MNP-M23]
MSPPPPDGAAAAPPRKMPLSDAALGILAMLGTTIVVPLMGMSVKLLAEEGLGAISTMALRSAGVLAFFLPLLLWPSNRRAIVVADKKAHFWHALFGLTSMACFYYGLGFLPLVVVTSINFTTPIFVMLLAIPLLSEKAGAGAFAAVGVGFLGTVLALEPAGEAFSGVSLVVLLGAFLTGCMIIAIRRMPAASTHFAVLFYYAALGTLVFGILALLTATPEDWTALKAPHTWVLVGLIAVLACALQYLLTIAYRLSASTSVAALDYLRLIWAALIGWYVFAEWPTPMAVAGMGLITASGVWLIVRQKKRRPAPLHAAQR